MLLTPPMLCTGFIHTTVGSGWSFSDPDCGKDSCECSAPVHDKLPCHLLRSTQTRHPGAHHSRHIGCGTVSSPGCHSSQHCRCRQASKPFKFADIQDRNQEDSGAKVKSRAEFHHSLMRIEKAANHQLLRLENILLELADCQDTMRNATGRTRCSSSVFRCS